MTTIHAKFYLKDTQYRVHARILGTTLVMKVYHGYGDKVHSNLVNMNYATLEDAKREAPLHAQQYAVENGTSISNIPGWQDGSKVRPEWFYAWVLLEFLSYYLLMFSAYVGSLCNEVVVNDNWVLALAMSFLQICLGNS